MARSNKGPKSNVKPSPAVPIESMASQNLDPLGAVPEAMEPNRDPQYNAQALIQRYWMRFMRAEAGVMKKHEQWRKIDLLWRGMQWEDKGIPPWIPKPVTNYIKYVVTTKRANLASAISRATFAPLTLDDMQVVYMLQRAVDHVWDHHRVDRTIRDCIGVALREGTSLAYVYNNDQFVGGKYYKRGDQRNRLYQGDIRVKWWANGTFFIDPDAYMLEQAKYIETTEIMPVNMVKQNVSFRAYCKKNGTLDKLEALNYSQVEIEDDASGTFLKRDNYPNQNLTNVSGDEEVTVHAHWERYFKNGDWHLDVTYYLRNTDFFLLRLEDVQPNEYPFAVLYDEKEINDFWGTSTAMDIKDNQSIINKTQQTAAILGTLHQNPQKIVFREAGINAQEMARTGNLPGKVWTSNVPPQEAVHLMTPPDIPKGLWELDDRTQNNIKTITGLTEAYMGQNTGSLTTSTGVDTLVERATVRDRDKMINIDEFVERISHLIALFALHKWKEPRPLMKMGINGIPEMTTWQPVSKLDAKNLAWRVKSNIYAKAPITQATRRQQADKQMQMQGQFNYNPPIITPEEWVLAQEFDNQEQILQRMEVDREKLEKQQQQDMAQMIMQVADHIRDLETNGESSQTVQQAAYQFAQQLMADKEQQDAKNGQQPNAPGQSQAPKGTTSQVAMANMANGS